MLRYSFAKVSALTNVVLIVYLFKKSTVYTDIIHK